MIKTAAIFPAQAARNSAPVLAAVRSSLVRAGVQVLDDHMDADAAVIWSVLWAGRMAANQAIYHHYLRLERPVIIVEVGSLRRGITWKIALDNVNGHGWFGDRQDLDLDRPKKFGLIRPVTTPGQEILIAAQHRRSLQAQGIADMEHWVKEKIRLARQHSDRPIVVRPHPRDPLRLGQLPHGVSLQRPRLLPGHYDSFDWQDAWHAVVNHNSGPGVLAAIAGVRPVVHESSLAWPVAVNINDIESPYLVDRERWLIDIAHTEYTIDEIAGGQWLKRLGSRL